MGGKCQLVVKKEKRSSSSGSGSGDDEYYWVKILLQSKFFGSCDRHDQQKKNVFCIDCNLGFCRHCMINVHRFHRCLQICKYVYHDVLRLQDIHKHLDCSKIQTYKINGEKAVHLNPRPQSKDSKPSTKLRTGTTCQACGKYLQDHPNRFCSIACKVWVVEMEGSKLEEEIIDDIEDEETSRELDKKKSSSGTGICWRDFCDDLQQQQQEWSNNNNNNNNSISNCRCSSATISSPPNSKIKRSSFKRKGIPRRAPLR